MVLKLSRSCALFFPALAITPYELCVALFELENCMNPELL